jgi:hypothetical protein
MVDKVFIFNKYFISYLVLRNHLFNFNQIFMIILYSDQKLPFGKYVGKLIQDVVAFDPNYFKRPMQTSINRKYAFADEVINKAYNKGTTITS